MRNELLFIEQIENYLAGKFTVEERTAFEQKINADESLRQDVELQKQIVDRIQLQAFKGEMVNFHKNFTVPSTSTFIKKGIWLNVFLGLVITGATAASVYYFTSSPLQTADTSTPAPTQEDDQIKAVAPGSLVAQTIAEVPKPVENKTVTNSTPVKKIVQENPDPIVPDLPEETPCKAFEQPFYSHEIDAEKGGSFKTNDSRSIFDFPAKIITHKNGSPVYGKVQIHYREYRNSADMAFSKIPMVYTENGKQFYFNSAGMFEVRAYQDGEELAVKPGASFKVHYNVTQKPDSCFFFALNDQTQQWSKKNPINFKKIVTQTGGQLFTKVVDVRNDIPLPMAKVTCRSGSQFLPYSDMRNDSGYRIASVSKGIQSFEVSCEGYESVLLNNIQIYDGKITQVNIGLVPAKKKEKVQPGVIKRTMIAIGNMFKPKEKKEESEVYTKEIIVRDSVGSNAVLPGKKAAIFNDVFSREEVVWSDNGDRTSNTMLVEGMDKGHTYPNMVKGLSCSTFGVYNCDQIYKVQDRITVQAEYKDENGNPIEAQHVLSMIDLKFNGAFSFSPENFTCSMSGRNVLLLFTNDKKLYALTEEEYKKMNLNKSGKYSFTMKEITAEVKDTNDLKKYLAGL